MSDKVFIKNGSSFDGHCGMLINYSPTVLEETLYIDDSIKISCPTWSNPSKFCIELKHNLKYLIIMNKRHCYLHNNEEIWFSETMSEFF